MSLMAPILRPQIWGLRPSHFSPPLFLSKTSAITSILYPVVRSTILKLSSSHLSLLSLASHHWKNNRSTFTSHSKLSVCDLNQLLPNFFQLTLIGTRGSENIQVFKTCLTCLCLCVLLMFPLPGCVLYGPVLLPAISELGYERWVQYATTASVDSTQIPRTGVNFLSTKAFTCFLSHPETCRYSR